MTDVQLYSAIGALVVLAVLSNRRRRQTARKVTRTVGRTLRAIWRAARWVWVRVRPLPRTPDGVPTIPMPGDVVERTVTKITDGDTLWLEGDTESSRPISINARERGQRGAGEATERLARLTPVGSRVLVATDPKLKGRSTRDRYGRHLVYLWREDGTSINVLMVWEGMARAEVYPRTDTYRTTFETAERAARTARRGIWAGTHRSLPAA